LIGPVSGAGIYSSNALLGLGVIQQKLEGTMAAARDACEDCSQGAWIGVEPFHQVDRVSIGGGLHVAGIACLQNGLRRNDDGAAACEVSEQQAEQQRHGPLLQDGPSAITVRDVAELVRDDTCDFVGILGLFDQAVEDIDDPPGKVTALASSLRTTMIRNGIGCPAACSSFANILSKAARPACSASPDPQTKRGPAPLLSRMLRTWASTAAPSLISAA